MPILTASGRISVKTLSICSFKNSGDTSKIPWSPVVFWAVSAVIALMAYTPLAVMVFKSAWIPAPPLESLPAIVNAVFIFIMKLLSCIYIFRRLKVVPPMHRRKEKEQKKQNHAGAQFHFLFLSSHSTSYVGMIQIRYTGPGGFQPALSPFPQAPRY